MRSGREGPGTVAILDHDRRRGGDTSMRPGRERPGTEDHQGGRLNPGVASMRPGREGPGMDRLGVVRPPRPARRFNEARARRPGIGNTITDMLEIANMLQ